MTLQDLKDSYGEPTLLQIPQHDYSEIDGDPIEVAVFKMDEDEFRFGGVLIASRFTEADSWIVNSGERYAVSELFKIITLIYNH